MFSIYNVIGAPTCGLRSVLTRILSVGLPSQSFVWDGGERIRPRLMKNKAYLFLLNDPEIVGKLPDGPETERAM